MKKLFTMLLMVCAIGVLGTSCGQKPDFTYQADVSGQLMFTKTETVSNFTAFVSNATLPLLFSATEDVPEPKAMAMTADAEDYFEQEIAKAVPPNTYYNITITGYATEKVTGITIAINKTFSNVPEEYRFQLTPIYDNTEPSPNWDF